jgi:hypothetical protein
VSGQGIAAAAEATDGQRFQARDRARSRGVRFPDHLVYPWPRRTRDVLFEEVPRLPPGVAEMKLRQNTRATGLADGLSRQEHRSSEDAETVRLG